MTWEYLVPILAIRINRYASTRNVNKSIVIYESIKDIAARICATAPARWVSLTEYFITFPYNFHSFVALQEKGRIDPTRKAIVKFLAQVDIENVKMGLYLSVYGI